MNQNNKNNGQKLNNAFLLIIIALAILIIFIRSPALTARTIHVDEATGIKSSELLLSGNYVFSPYNGHGPTFIYFGAIVRSIFGTNVVFFRALTALFMLFSLFILWLAYKKDLNEIGKIVLLISLGLSSGMLFFSVYFIHEMLLILLTVLTLASVERWLKTEKKGWLALSVIFFCLMYMTKETALFTYTAWFLAGILTIIFNKKTDFIKKSLTQKNFLYIFAGLILSGLLYILFFGKSLDLFLAPYLWLTKRALTLHLKPWYYFGALLYIHEIFLVLFSAFSCVYITIKKLWSPRILFFALWFLIIIIVYSLIPYKTPWLIPNIILPLALFAAFSASKIWPNADKIFLSSIIVILSIISLATLWQDNFLHPDRTQIFDYAYYQSGKGFNELTNILESASKIAQKDPAPLQIIGSNDELLSLITEKYDKLYGSFVAGLPVYINYYHSAEKMKAMAGDNYVFLKFTYCTPGPEIDMLIRKDIWNIYKCSPNFIPPAAVWPDGTLRYD